MMCNPNQVPDTTPSGPNPSGFWTGSSRPTINRFLIEDHGLLEITAREVHRQILQFRENWLQQALEDRGMPMQFLDGVKRKSAVHLKCAAVWLRQNGYAWGSNEINTIQLFQHGKLVLCGTLFELPPALQRKSENFYQYDFFCERFTQGQGS